MEKQTVRELLWKIPTDSKGDEESEEVSSYGKFLYKQSDISVQPFTSEMHPSPSWRFETDRRTSTNKRDQPGRHLTKASPHRLGRPAHAQYKQTRTREGRGKDRSFASTEHARLLDACSVFARKDAAAGFRGLPASHRRWVGKEAPPT